MSLSSSNIRILENCVTRAVVRIFGVYDKISLYYTKLCSGIYNIKGLVEDKHCSFIDKLLCDVRFLTLLLDYAFNTLCRL